MKPLGMTFRLDDIIEAGRDLHGVLSEATVSACVNGLLGKLGYRVTADALVTGRVYRTSNDEVVVDCRVSTTLEYDCVRCLTACTLSVDTRQDHVLVRGAAKPQIEAMELTDADAADDVDTFQGDEIELESIVRQDLILALPMNPSCVDGNENTCQYEAYRSKNEEASVDPRWAALAEMKKKLKPVKPGDE